MEPTSAIKAQKKTAIFRAALLMLRRRFMKPKPTAIDSGDSIWKLFLGSMRPLHIQCSSPAPEKSEEVPAKLEEVPVTPLTPARSSSLSGSQYGSASNLQELDEEEEAMRGDGGDEMIDAKADEFIAQFYMQMRLQRTCY